MKSAQFLRTPANDCLRKTVHETMQFKGGLIYVLCWRSTVNICEDFRWRDI